jgi:hypothetical protein
MAGTHWALVRDFGGDAATVALLDRDEHRARVGAVVRARGAHGVRRF